MTDLYCINNGSNAWDGDDDLLADEEQLECQACGEVETILLGTMGDTTHYRCRACGADSYDVPPQACEGWVEGEEGVHAPDEYSDLPYKLGPQS